MINYYKCEIINSDEKIIELECNNIGYTFEVINYIPIKCEKVYIHAINTEYTTNTYAFSNSFERNTFRSLLLIKGVGVKTITLIFKTYSAKDIENIVKNKEIEKLLIIPGIGRVTANTILGTVSDEYSKEKRNAVKKVLRGFGYSTLAINSVIHMIDLSDDIENIVKKTIKKL